MNERVFTWAQYYAVLKADRCVARSRNNCTDLPGPNKKSLFYLEQSQKPKPLAINPISKPLIRLFPGSPFTADSLEKSISVMYHTRNNELPWLASSTRSTCLSLSCYLLTFYQLHLHGHHLGEQQHWKALLEGSGTANAATCSLLSLHWVLSLLEGRLKWRRPEGIAEVSLVSRHFWCCFGFKRSEIVDLPWSFPYPKSWRTVNPWASGERFGKGSMNAAKEVDKRHSLGSYIHSPWWAIARLCCARL